MESGTDRKLIERLNGFLFKDQILDSELWREIYARDASYFDIKPKCGKSSALPVNRDWA